MLPFTMKFSDLYKLVCRTGGFVRSFSRFARALVYFASPANPPVLQANLKVSHMVKVNYIHEVLLSE